MLQKKYEQVSELVLVFNFLFLSNASAFIYIVWLTPEVIFVESITWMMLAILSVWILNKHNLIPSFFVNLKRNWIIIPFLFFSGLSIFWSVYWSISFSRWMVLVFTIIAGGFIGLRYNLKEIIKLLSVFGICILFVSSILVFFVPRLGVMNYYTIHGAWKGLYWHKNHMGLVVVFVNSLFLIDIVYSWQSKERNAFLWGVLYLFSMFFIYQTDSVAAYFTTILLHGLILLALFLLKFGKKIRRSHYFIFFIIVIFGLLVSYINANRLFGVFGRNTTLTGRVPMWAYLFDAYIARRPIGGYGFNAFWYIDSHRVDIGLAAGYPDPIVIADNGFIDILVNTGYGGLLLFSIFYFGAWWRSVKYARNAVDIHGFFPVIFMSYTLLANISWSLVFENENFFMLIMIAVLFFISSDAQINRENS